MRTAALTITFEPKGVARLIRDAGERKEFRLKTPQGSVMERLVLEVLGGRRASWRTNYDVVKGSVRTRRKLKIGDATTALPAIRERWLVATGRIEKGGDPVGDLVAQRLIDTARSEMTFAKLADEFIASKEKGGMRTIGEVRRIIEKDCLPTLAKRPVCEIDPLEIEAITERIAERDAPVSARAAHVHLQSAFEWALGTARWRAAGLLANPARLIKKAKPPAPKTRKLNNDELRQFWAALDRSQGMEVGTADCFKLMLLLARRSGEMIRLPWVELELDRADPLWRLPAPRSKNKQEILIPLSAATVAILSRRRAVNVSLAEPHLFVFPGLADKPMTAGALRTALRRLFESRQLTHPPFSVHDIRRTVAHRCSEELDFDNEVIKAFLGHAASNVTDKNYSQASKLNRTRRLVDAWAAHLQNILEGKSDSNIVPLRSSIA
jgi:integrase